MSSRRLFLETATFFISKPSQCGALGMCITVPFVRIFNYYIIRTSPDVRISEKSRLKCPLEMQIPKRLRQFFLVAALKHGQTLHHLPASVFIPTCLYEDKTSIESTHTHTETDLRPLALPELVNSGADSWLPEGGGGQGLPQDIPPTDRGLRG